uniref:Uncharacterized protein n=1 Tax=Cacopsylla melanoneura TaxID=428564 RepID=A0A8D8ZJ16_9HEMI
MFPTDLFHVLINVCYFLLCLTRFIYFEPIVLCFMTNSRVGKRSSWVRVSFKDVFITRQISQAHFLWMSCSICVRYYLIHYDCIHFIPYRSCQGSWTFMFFVVFVAISFVYFSYIRSGTENEFFKKSRTYG